MEKELENIEFELEGEEFDSMEEAKLEEEEYRTLFFRRTPRERRKSERQSPLNFFSNFALSTTNDDPRNVKEVFDSQNSGLWKKAMVEEMDSLDKK